MMASASSATALGVSALSDSAVKHLELIQAVITRMGQNSFFVKGWSIALVTATLALASQQLALGVFVLALFPSASFWYLDAYYLHQERLYRRLYRFIAQNGHSPDGERFSMNTSTFLAQESFRKAATSRTIMATHLTIIVVILICVVSGTIWKLLTV